VYRTELPPPFAETLAGLIGAEAQTLIGSVSVGTPMQTNDDLDYWEQAAIDSPSLVDRSAAEITTC
jgi:hypothetical protein